MLNRWTLALTLQCLLATSALAHHGWRWTSDTNVEVSGIIESAALGNPHGILILDVDGEKWTAEVGQPWRNERAGITDNMLAPGVEIIIEGQRSQNKEQLLVKAERLIIDGKRYVLYPDRD